ncbi:hypothetical protein V1477_016202, partial [Vespula maculifrons]
MNGTISRRTNSTTVLHVSTYRACPISSPRTRARIEWCSYMATVYKCGKSQQVDDESAGNRTPKLVARISILRALDARLEDEASSRKELDPPKRGR